MLAVILETFETYRIEEKKDLKVMVEVQTSGDDDTSDNQPNRWKVEQRRQRRWSRDLLVNEATYISKNELEDLKESFGIDPSKLKPRNQKQTSSTLNRLIMGKLNSSK